MTSSRPTADDTDALEQHLRRALRSLMKWPTPRRYRKAHNMIRCYETSTVAGNVHDREEHPLRIAVHQAMLQLSLFRFWAAIDLLKAPTTCVDDSFVHQVLRQQHYTLQTWALCWTNPAEGRHRLSQIAKYQDNRRKGTRRVIDIGRRISPRLAAILWRLLLAHK